MVFSSIDNRVTAGTFAKTFKSIQPDKKSLINSKENRNSHAFITSPYDHQVSTRLYHHSPPRSTTTNSNRYISQTFTTNHEKVVNRPTMGGKTISAIHHLPANTVIRSPNLMSSQELKLLSRRINPHEPLASPHASPTKPPLPNICLQSRKRARQQQLQRAANHKLQKVQHTKEMEALVVAPTQPVVVKEEKEEAVLRTTTTTTHPFMCEPCNKKYKTRNGLNYHLERCKFLLSQAAAAAAAAATATPSIVSNVIIKCICSHPTDDTNTMIECIECQTWLHLKCAAAHDDGYTNESTYCCPRCLPAEVTTSEVKQEEVSKEDEEEETKEEDDDDEEEDNHLLQNGITVKLSELCQAKERGKNLLESFKQVEQQEEIERPLRNEFNFISLFSDEAVFDEVTTATAAVTAATTTTTTTTEEEAWDTTANWNSSVPSLLFDEQEPSSFMDDSTSLLLSPQADWLHFANFEVDFTSTTQEDDDDTL